MSKYFGTDGFRGEAGITLTTDHAYKIGRFLGWYYGKTRTGSRCRAVLGKDTRRSSYMFEYAVSAGLAASGADVSMLHVITTPGVSYVTRTDGFDCGIMISASHNPFGDNGIKLMNSRGEKMEDETLDAAEAYLDGERETIGIEGGDIPFASGADIGQIIDYSAGRNRYIGYLISIAVHSYKGMRIGLDCANGSAWMLAKSVFDALGAKTYLINAAPDGLNINQNAGSTHIEVLSAWVKEQGLDLGFAFDGDADRCLAVDHEGGIVTGDHILYIFAEDLRAHGGLVNNTVVTTVMSNLGLYRALERAGIGYVQTKVGDRYVYENMTQTGNCVGGEQSGHIILSKYGVTGDGILTAIRLMDIVTERRLPLKTLAEPVVMLPQVMKNVRVADKAAVRENEAVQRELRAIREELGDTGRILLRESGTEPVVRVMAEAETEALCEALTGRVVRVIHGENLAVQTETERRTI